jgi:hypothetical protein
MKIISNIEKFFHGLIYIMVLLLCGEDSIKEEQEARDTWVCGICNESTYAVDWDYIGSGTNHLNCELKQDD